MPNHEDIGGEYAELLAALLELADTERSRLMRRAKQIKGMAARQRAKLKAKDQARVKDAVKPASWAPKEKKDWAKHAKLTNQAGETVGHLDTSSPLVTKFADNTEAFQEITAQKEADQEPTRVRAQQRLAAREAQQQTRVETVPVGDAQWEAQPVVEQDREEQRFRDGAGEELLLLGGGVWAVGQMAEAGEKELGEYRLIDEDQARDWLVDHEWEVIGEGTDLDQVDEDKPAFVTGDIFYPVPEATPEVVAGRGAAVEAAEEIPLQVSGSAEVNGREFSDWDETAEEVGAGPVSASGAGMEGRTDTAAEQEFIFSPQATATPSAAADADR